MVVGYTKTKLGSQELTISYEELECTGFEVLVKDYQTGIVFTKPSKTTYEYGEELDLKGGTIARQMASGAVVDQVPLARVYGEWI